MWCFRKNQNQGVREMTKLGNRIMCGDFDALREVIEFTGIAGQWAETENHCQFRAVSRAVLNYWKTTGTITFQGPELAAAELKAVFLKRAVLIK
jgi:hypothetical protein